MANMTELHSRVYELPADYGTEQLIIDGIARDMNGGALQTPYGKREEVAGTLVVARRAYRLGRSAVEASPETFHDILEVILRKQSETFHRAHHTVMRDEHKKSLVERAFSTGRAHRNTMVEEVRRPVHG